MDSALLTEDLALLMGATVLLMGATVLLMEDTVLLMEDLALLMEDLALLMVDLALLMEDLALLMVDLALLMVDLALPFKPVLQVTSAARAMEIVKRIRIVAGDYFVEKIIAGENLDLAHLKEFPGKIRMTAALTISTFATRPKCSHHPGEPAALPLTPAHSAMETVTQMRTVNLVSCVGTTTAKTFIQERAIKMTAVHTEMMEVDQV